MGTCLPRRKFDKSTHFLECTEALNILPSNRKQNSGGGSTLFGTNLGIKFREFDAQVWCFLKRVLQNFSVGNKFPNTKTQNANMMTNFITVATAIQKAVSLDAIRQERHKNIHGFEKLGFLSMHIHFFSQ